MDTPPVNYTPSSRPIFYPVVFYFYLTELGEGDERNKDSKPQKAERLQSITSPNKVFTCTLMHLFPSFRLDEMRRILELFRPRSIILMLQNAFLLYPTLLS